MINTISTKYIFKNITIPTKFIFKNYGLNIESESILNYAQNHFPNLSSLFSRNFELYTRHVNMRNRKYVAVICIFHPGLLYYHRQVSFHRDLSKNRIVLRRLVIQIATMTTIQRDRDELEFRRQYMMSMRSEEKPISRVQKTQYTRIQVVQASSSK